MFKNLVTEHGTAPNPADRRKTKKQDGRQKQDKRENTCAVVKAAVKNQAVGKNKGNQDTDIENGNIDRGYLKTEDAGIREKYCGNHYQAGQCGQY